MISLFFKNIEFDGFQSLGTGKLELINLGTCLIKGVNNSSDKCTSNGSGKSSLVESICWCLFGKTANGISNDVVNKYYDKGCFVKLNIDVDNQSYTIIRSIKHKQYGTSLSIYLDDEIISARNKTDTNKLIEQLIHIDFNMFLQLIYLSQGQVNRFTNYTPKVRKEILENIYNVNDNIDIFITKLKTKESQIKQTLENYNDKLIELNSTIKANNNTITTMQTLIGTKEQQKNELEKYNSIISENKLSELEILIESIQVIINGVTGKLSDTKTLYHNNHHTIKLYEQQLKSFKTDIQTYSNNKVCPTCNTILEDYENNEGIQKQKEILSKKIDRLTNLKQKLLDENNKYNLLIDKLNEKIKLNENKKNKVIMKLQTLKENYKKQIKKDNEIQTIVTYINEQNKLIKSMQIDIDNNMNIVQETTIEKDIAENRLAIISHIVKLSNTHFKAYLLNGIITTLNEELFNLSQSLFDNEIIILSGDTKLDIMLNDKYYEQLSGGEKNKVNIAIIIAQRKLAQQMNVLTTNLVIADEIFDGLDDMSFNIVMDILSDEIQDIDSLLLISHRDIFSIPYDNQIIVAKNKNNISILKTS